MPPMTFQPGQVLFGGGGPNPYISTNSNPSSGSPSSSFLGGETIRATGTGPFDAAYRQNLATYAGGLVQRPGGFLGFNPTGKGEDMGNTPTGGGSDPVLGSAPSLLGGALGGNPFTVPNPQQVNSGDNASSTGPTPGTSLQWWLKQLGQQGSSFGLGGF